MIPQKKVMMILFCLTIDCTLAEPVPSDSTTWEKVKKYFDSGEDIDEKGNETQEKSENNGNSEEDKNLTKDTVDWLKKDVKNIGAWEYKVVRLDIDELSKIEEQLNLLGQEKWQCFWIKEDGDKAIMFFKRAKLSYLKSLPLKDLLKLISLSSGEE